MATESFLVTALPHSADPADPFHVSLFVTHRLTPDGAAGTLADFPNVVDWTARLADAEFSLQGRTAGGATVAIGVTPDLDALDPALWPHVFPSDLAVLPWQTPNHTAVPWRTFAAHRVQQHALFVHAVSMFSSPVTAPTVAGNALTGPLLATLGLDVGRRGLTIEQILDPTFDERATNMLDDLTNQGFLGSDSVDSSAAQPLRQLVFDLHRARRYYQREEEQTPYRDRPKPGAVAVPVTKPKPDFHERAGMLGDLSPLLRRLGLVIDLVVDDPAQLAGIVSIRPGLVVPDLANTIQTQPATACAVTGTLFTATSGISDWTHGMLRLGDEDTFTVLDLDPDASALKLEGYVRNVPRLSATENNGDRVNSAPPSLRATGLAVARIARAEALHGRLDGAAAKDAALLAGTAPPLTQEQITRGVRLEVWDDVSTDWHSLHLRRLSVDVDGAEVLKDAPDEGFLQGASLTQADGQPAAPMNAHEVLAGWDGWSLSAPRPGRVVVHVNGKEEVMDAPPPDPDPVNPVASRTAIEPGTLPRLRYGRRYAFRGYAVDLAGNSAPHVVAGAPAPGGGGPVGGGPGGGGPGGGTAEAVAKSATAFAETTLAAASPEATVSPVLQSTRVALDVVRREVRSLRPLRQDGPIAGRGPAGPTFAGLEATGIAAVDQVIRSRLATRADRAGPATPSRRARIEAAFDELAEESPYLLVRTQLETPAATYGLALGAAAAGQAGLAALAIGELITLIGQVVTTPRPFLRWDPVIEPAIVPRHAFSEGESLQRLVVRSGVVGPAEPDGLDVTLVDPATYVAQTVAAHPTLGLAWRADSQRHLAPPKTSQFEAELHGVFDTAIGSGSAVAIRDALAVALRESGTFLETTVADLTKAGKRIKQPNVTFHTSPTAEEPKHSDPKDLPRGDPLTPGQYVAHDVDAVVVPYLPDPLATGLSMTFPDAGKDHRLTSLFAIEGTNLRYAGDWPEPVPYRLVLVGGNALGAEVVGNEIRIAVPPGERLTMRLSSSIDRASLSLLGLWRSLPAAFQQLDVLAEAAADGWLWWLTPSVEVTLVHAVPKPVEVPRPTILVPVRANLDTAVALFGAVDVHGPSTERIDIEAEWSEWVDDVAKPAPERVETTAAACGTEIGYDEDLVVLSAADANLPLPNGTSLRLHGAVHQLGDTKHRAVDYRVRATTRYREYFSPQVTPSPDDLSLVGPVHRLNVPSSARPRKALVHDVLPLFRWDERTEPDQPFGLRRTRRSGVRIYLDRPWYSSGDGELLGILVAGTNDEAVQRAASQWAADPVWLQQGPASRAALPLTDFLRATGLDDRPEPGRPVRPAALLPLVDLPGAPQAWVLGYEPEFSAERGLWFVDVAFDPGAAFWPFVRLALARYQPDSNAGMHLSALTQCDFVQLPPERTATMSRPDDRHVRIVVTGPVGALRDVTPPSGLAHPTFAARVNAARTMRARLEQRDPTVATDLGWTTVATTDLPILGVDGTIVSWLGQLELPVDLEPRRPGENADWRVVLEEWERFQADPLPDGGPRLETRIVYADHLPL